MLLLDRQESVGIITLNRPEKLNAFNRALIMELDQALSQFEKDDLVKVIVVTGAGERAFSAGADIHERIQHSETEYEEQRYGADWVWHLAMCKKPTIGAINGLAYGGGALMASIFDIRIGCERTSFRFLGVVYGLINSTWTLPLIVGWPVAKELLLTGRTVEPEEALNIRLLNKLVPSADLMKFAVEMGQNIGAHDASVVQVMREILVRNIGLNWREMFLNESEAASGVLKTLSLRKSFKNFLERKSKK